MKFRKVEPHRNDLVNFHISPEPHRISAESHHEKGKIMQSLKTGQRHQSVKPRLIKQREQAIERGFRPNRSKDAIERNALYNTREWRELRKQVLTDEPRCRHCGAPASHVDHKEHGADWRSRFFDRSNLQPLCAPCHNHKSAKERAASQRKPNPYERFRKT